MPRLTLQGFREAVNWPQALNMSPQDPRWLMWLNELLQRLLAEDLYVGTTQRYAICANSGCITWPRQFETIEAMDYCDRPVPLRNHWFEFLENGPGRFKSGPGCQTFNAVDRGKGFVMFDDVTVPSRIRLYTQFASDAGKTVTIRGFDSNAQEVLTSGGATVGERMTLSSSYVDSQTVWMAQVFAQVLKDPTVGYVRAFSWDASLPPPPASPGPNDTPLKPLAAWEPGETLPDYRRTFFPAVANYAGGCCGSGYTSVQPPNNGCPVPVTLTVRAKIAHIAVSAPLDFLWTANVPALKLGMMSLMQRERGNAAEAKNLMYGTFNPVTRKMEDGCIPLMEEELESMQGRGTIAVLRLESGLTDRAQVLNLI